MLTQKQQELVALLKGALPTAPPEVAQANVDWYKTWVHGEQLQIGDRRSWEGILYEVYTPAGGQPLSAGPGASDL